MAEAEKAAGAGGSTAGAGAGGRRWLRAGLAVVLAGKLALAGLWAGGALASGAGGGGTAANPDAPPGGTPAGGAAGERERPLLSGIAARPPGGDAPAGGRGEVRALLEALQRRQAELDARERELARKDERLALFEQDVTAKIARLEEIEKRLLDQARAERAAVDTAAASLAKIYAAMKPAAAAPILDQLDDATVLAILGQMKAKEVGEILPLMSREKAIVVTRALAARR
jgi:flagellar protein FlbB